MVLTGGGKQQEENGDSEGRRNRRGKVKMREDEDGKEVMGIEEWTHYEEGHMIQPLSPPLHTAISEE